MRRALPPSTCLDMSNTRLSPEKWISAGFDAHRKDPLAQLEWTERSYEVMTKRMMELAQKCCQGRLLSMLEGGYQLGSLSSSVSTHIRALME